MSVVYSSWGFHPTFWVIIREQRAQPRLCPRPGAAPDPGSSLGSCDCRCSDLLPGLPFPWLWYLARGERGLEESFASTAMGRGGYTDTAVTQGWLSSLHHGQGRLLEGQDYIMALSLQVRRCKMRLVGAQDSRYPLLIYCQDWGPEEILGVYLFLELQLSTDWVFHL